MATEQDIRNAMTIALPDLQVAHFAVAIEDALLPVRAGFRECRGLGGTLQSFSINEPGDDKQRQFPQRAVFKPVTLVKGLDVDGHLFKWWQQAKEWRPGQPDYHKTVTVYALQRVSETVAIARRGWDLFRAYPTDWDGPEHNALGVDIAFERVTLNYEEMESAPFGAFVNLI